MISFLFNAGSFGYAAIQGVDAFIDKTIRYAVSSTVKAALMNKGDADRIVQLAKSRVPKKSGNLFNSIHSYQTSDGAWVVTADATAATGTYDTYYARFVELGTQSGIRGRSTAVADDSYFADDGMGPKRGRPRIYAAGARGSRRQYRTHPGTAPQPFLLNSAAEVLGDRLERTDKAMDDAARDAGLL